MDTRLDDRPVRIGAALALTGRFATQGQQAARGLQLWAEDLNAAGGLAVSAHGGGRPIELIVLDDASRAGRVARQVERLLAQDRVDLLIGPYASNLALAAAEVAERFGIPIWNHGGSSDAIAERGFRWLVNLASPASRYFVGLLELVRTQAPGLTRLALVQGASGTFPAAVAGGAERTAPSLGFELVYRGTYPTDRDGFPRLAQAVADRRPELVLGVGTTESDQAFARALLACPPMPRLVGLVATPIERFAAELGPAATGFLGPSQWEPALRYQPDLGPTPAELAARFQTRFGLTADYPAAQGYAAGLVAQRCVELAGTLAPAPLRAAAARLTITTCYGDFQIDARGEQQAHRLAVIQWQNSRKRVLWPPEAAEVPLRLSRT
jgi:branched-chain amino acid transport system substrate-binding protein